jgi:hypothetical protein
MSRIAALSSVTHHLLIALEPPPSDEASVAKLLLICNEKKMQFENENILYTYLFQMFAHVLHIGNMNVGNVRRVVGARWRFG